MKKYLQDLIARLENGNIPLINYFLLFIASTTLRNFLEIFSDRARVPFCLFDAQQAIYYSQWIGLFLSFIHYYLVWIAIALGAVIIFKSCAGIPFRAGLRAVCALFFIINITPLWDLFISHGFGRDLAYLKPEGFFDIFPFPRGLTPGMLMTSLSGLVMAYMYSFLKANSHKKALFSVLGLYGLLLFFALLPWMLKLTHPVMIMRVVWLVILLELCWVSFIAHPALFKALLKDVRALRLIYFLLLFIMGIFLIQGRFFILLTHNGYELLLTLLVVALCWYVGVIFNNIEDRTIDEVSNVDRPLISSLISLQDYRNLGIALIVVNLWTALLVNFQTALFALLLMGSTFFYSLPPIRGKRIPVFSKIFASFNCLLLVMLGFIFAGGDLRFFPPIVSWYFLACVTLMYNFIDLKDRGGDARAGVMTLPVLLGMRKAQIVIGAICLVGYTLLGFVFVNKILIVLTFIVGIIQCYLITRRDYQDRLVMAVHILIVTTVILFLVFSSSPVQQQL